MPLLFNVCDGFLGELISKARYQLTQTKGLCRFGAWTGWDSNPEPPAVLSPSFFGVLKDLSFQRKGFYCKAGDFGHRQFVLASTPTVDLPARIY